MMSTLAIKSLDHFKLVDYIGGFPGGSFAYPFQYRLPPNLPGNTKLTLNYQIYQWQVFSKRRRKTD
jgi:hypothetical protein